MLSAGLAHASQAALTLQQATSNSQEVNSAANNSYFVRNFTAHSNHNVVSRPRSLTSLGGNSENNQQFDVKSVEENALANGGYLNVWKNNIDAAFAILRANLKRGYKYVSMDTEFPGVVAKPVGDMKDYIYQCLKCNVDMLKLIQVGLTLFDKNGNTPDIHTWQFNLHFDLKKDMYAQDSIELLQKAGINFRNHDTDGIDELKFASLLITSGLVLVPGVTWISFHSIYDFGYLLRILMNKPLPNTESNFYFHLKLYFKEFYDIKLVTDTNTNYKGGLQELGHKYKVERVGKQHQAGSDAHLTGKIFFAMKAEENSDINFEMLDCQLFSLSNANSTITAIEDSPTKQDCKDETEPDEQ